VVYVDPKHTSQTCPICGHQAKENRVKGRINSIAKGKENSRAKKQTILI
jgi:transposase